MVRAKLEEVDLRGARSSEKTLQKAHRTYLQRLEQSKRACNPRHNVVSELSIYRSI
jgi:hypothetical protein